METLSDLEQIRKRPAIRVGDTGKLGLHQWLCELLGNTIDWYLSGQPGSVRAVVGDCELDCSDDGPVVPLDVKHDSSWTPATQYRTSICRDSATADGYMPHVRLVAFTQEVSACNLHPAVGLIHVVMRTAKFAVPTKSKLNRPDLVSPICQAIQSSVTASAERR